MPKLTKTFIENLSPSKSEKWFPDTEVNHLYVRTRSNGEKSYFMRFWIIVDNKRIQRKMKLAACSSISPEKAREIVRKHLGLIAEGIDPFEQRKQKKENPTLQDLKDRYMEEHAIPFKKPSSRKLDESLWLIHILPKLREKKVREIEESDIAKLFATKHKTPAVGNQCLALLSKAFNLAEKWKWRERHTNPCEGIKKYTLKKRQLILTEGQIRSLWLTLAKMEREKRVSVSMANLIRLLMLTGCRLREIMHARKEWISIERRVLQLPDSKTGQKQVALSQAALNIIKGMDPSQEWLCPGHVKGKPLHTPDRKWGQIKEEAGIPKEFRIHDLRHTAGSLAHMSGLSQREIMVLLGHQQLSTTERYLHGHQGEGQSLADRMANIIMSEVNPTSIVRKKNSNQNALSYPLSIQGFTPNQITTSYEVINKAIGSSF